MPRLRFVTARDLFEAYPIALDETDLQPTDDPSLDFMRALADSGEPEKAIGFCAFLLPRREAVGWAVHSVKAIITARTRDEELGLRAAEAWLREPEEDRRLAALRAGQEGRSDLPTTWLALAAGWAGPTIPAVNGGEPQAIPAHQTARAVRVAVLLAGSRAADFSERDETLRKCIENGAKVAMGEELRT